MKSVKNLNLSRLGGIVLVAMLVTGCAKKEEAPAPAPVRPIKIVELGGGEMRRMIELPGQIQSLREARIGFEVPGLLQGTLVDEGNRVKQGDVLARLDDRDFRAARDSAQAQLTAARSEAARAQALFDRQATSKQRLDVALANLQVAESAFHRAQKALDDTVLRAPMDGSVARVLVDDIENVQAKQPIMIVHDLSRFKIVVDVPETLAVLVDPTIPAEVQNERFESTVFLTTGSTQGFPAEVLESAKLADPVTRTFAVTLAFDPPPTLNVLPGMTARLRVDATAVLHPDGTQLEVPSDAIGGQWDGQPFVWKIDPASMTVSKVAVQLGQVSGDDITVASESLALGDLIAASGLLHLREGMRVRLFEP